MFSQQVGQCSVYLDVLGRDVDARLLVRESDCDQISSFSVDLYMCSVCMYLNSVCRPIFNQDAKR